MPTDSQKLREHLLSSDEEFRQLAAKHSEYDVRLRDLSAKPHLSEPERLEQVTLKKRKLQLKDQMEDILRRHKTTDAQPAVPSTSHSDMPSA